MRYLTNININFEQQHCVKMSKVKTKQTQIQKLCPVPEQDQKDLPNFQGSLSKSSLILCRF